MAHACDDFLLYVVAAALLDRRREMLRARGLDDLLLMVARLGPRLRLGPMLRDAHALYAAHPPLG